VLLNQSLSALKIVLKPITELPYFLSFPVNNRSRSRIQFAE